MDNQENQPIDPLGSIEPLRTFEPTPMVPPTPAQPAQNAAPAVLVDREGNVNLTQLQTEERQKYEVLANSIDEANPGSIVNFGAELQKTLTNQSDSFLGNVRRSNSGEVGGLINDLLVELNYVDVEELNGNKVKSFLSKLPFMKKVMTQVENLFAKYDKIINNIEQISYKVNAGIITSTKDNAVLQTIFESNVNSIKQIEDLVIAGNIRMERAAVELAQMEANPQNFQDYQIADKRDFIARLDRRMADLKVVRVIMMQSLPQIRLVQNNNVSIAEKAQTILTTTLPVWKNQLSLAVAMYRQQQNIEIQQKVSHTTEEILRKNAERLGQNSINVARANEQTIVSVETLRETTSMLINTLNEVKQIQKQGADNRRKLDQDLQTLEHELKANVRG
ncbi:toxic anion resistance protein [Chryseobacterium indologenes]|uniref:toxic anion resistance protein n=1 Tax=Chryseobacterium indologenes TaxID=253 RepID=UPI00102476BD|nr:toxic anion resistance protein [Chryseobacterium indologenes]MBF6645935.1 toxic anion resistance protein [Chryseobacterium indologenes]MBU3049704.1 toxic anion resistance protein [Chryseobacterium indologenes]MEB4760981.1 toxic anion resistance protein [Chryseobacterium indologenes]QQQ70402.1 toxic anion resistance protein [Chryseobacterium indologenes]VFA43650.1 TelA-like protein SA1238 [Chryseobacterium indologenes]